MTEVGKNSIFTCLKTKFLKKMPLKLVVNFVNHCNSNGVSLPHFSAVVRGGSSGAIAPLKFRKIHLNHLDTEIFGNK